MTTTTASSEKKSEAAHDSHSGTTKKPRQRGSTTAATARDGVVGSASSPSTACNDEVGTLITPEEDATWNGSSGDYPRTT